jgi:hypothetical protein
MIQRILHSRHFLACLLSAATEWRSTLGRHSRKTISFCGSWPFALCRPFSFSSTPTPSSSIQRLTSCTRSCFPASTFSPSKHDWAYAKRALARGDDLEVVIQRIADYRGDKKHANYARHTGEKARQELEGASGLQHSRETYSDPVDAPDRQE